MQALARARPGRRRRWCCRLRRASHPLARRQAQAAGLLVPGADLQALGGPCRGDFEEPPSSLSPTRVIAAECAYQVVVEAEIFPPILNLLKDFDVYVRKNAATCIREAPREKPTFPLVVRCRSRRYPDSIAMRPIDRRTAAAQLPAADMEGGRSRHRCASTPRSWPSSWSMLAASARWSTSSPTRGATLHCLARCKGTPFLQDHPG